MSTAPQRSSTVSTGSQQIWHDSWTVTGMRQGCRVILLFLGLAAIPVTGIADPFANLPDPTRPSSWQDGIGSTVNQGLVLQSTTVSASRRVAVISGQRLTVGDRVQGATVTEIQPFQVMLQRGGRDIALRLTPPLAKEKR